MFCESVIPAEENTMGQQPSRVQGALYANASDSYCAAHQCSTGETFSCMGTADLFGKEVYLPLLLIKCVQF